MSTKSKTVIKAEATLFSRLFYKGHFEVPWHQRYYDWTASNVRALLHDIDDKHREEGGYYFLGAIMLVQHKEQQWKINDGQQRMITISLICAVLCKRFSDEEKGSQREGQALRILFDLNPDSTCTLDDAECYTPRISPPSNDKTRYFQMIRGNTIGTNGLLTRAWAVIEDFFSSKSSSEIKAYFDFLLNRLEVVCLFIPADSDPNAVYETLNFRGKKLDDLDLIRNYIYSHFNETVDCQRRNTVHDDLERIRTVLPATEKASEYMRCHLQCKFGFLPKDDFYRAFRESIHHQDSGLLNKKNYLANFMFNLTRQIASRESLELFQIITLPNSGSESIRKFETASGTTKSRRRLTVFLRELRIYKVTLPLIFAMLTRYIHESDDHKKKQVAKIANKNLRRLTAFVLRTAFVAPKFEPSHFEKKFSNYARKIAIAPDFPDADFADFLRHCDQEEIGVLDDDKFRASMLEANMKGTIKIRQFLLGINNHLQTDSLLLNERQCSIEHILPKSPMHQSSWTGFEKVDAADWAHRIGNLTLMGPEDNKPGAKYNGDFEKKRRSYENSSIKVTRELNNYSDWNPDIIKARQKEMVNVAIKVWSFE